MTSFYVIYIEGDKKLLSFDQWCLSESIVDTPTEFGTNAEMNNSKINSDLGMHHTFFKHKGMHHCVFVTSKGDVGIGSSKKHSTSMWDYSDNRQPHSNPISAFGKTMYVVHHIANNLNIKHIKFKGADPRLGVMYNHLM